MEQMKKFNETFLNNNSGFVLSHKYVSRLEEANKT